MQTSTPHKARLLHRVVLFVVAFAHPAASWIWGDGAYAMYARTARYRFALTSVDAGGERRAIAPSTLRGRVGGGAEMLLGAGEREMEVPEIPAFRRHLADYARLACASAPDAVEVTATLEERARETDAPRTTSATARCAR